MDWNKIEEKLIEHINSISDEQFLEELKEVGYVDEYEQGIETEFLTYEVMVDNTTWTNIYGDEFYKETDVSIDVELEEVA